MRAADALCSSSCTCTCRQRAVSGLSSKRRALCSLDDHHQLVGGGGASARARSAWAAEIDILLADTAPPPSRSNAESSLHSKLWVNELALARAWESSQRVTKEDW